MAEEDGIHADDEGPHQNYIYRGKEDSGYRNQVCRKISESRIRGSKVEVEFADGHRAMVPRWQLRNVSSKE